MFGCVPNIFRLFYIVLPDMPGYCFRADFAVGASGKGRAFFADITSAFVFPVSLTVGCCIMQNLIFWADYAVIIFVIHIFPPFRISCLGHGPLVRCGQDSSIIKDAFANMWCFVGGICHHSFNFRECLCYTVIDRVKRYLSQHMTRCTSRSVFTNSTAFLFTFARSNIFHHLPLFYYFTTKKPSFRWNFFDRL